MPCIDNNIKSIKSPNGRANDINNVPNISINKIKDKNL
jgi:hypothetical protein